KKSIVEVSTRGFDIYDLGRNGSLVRATIYEDQGLMIKGIVFQHTANTMHQDALNISNTSNVLIEDCVFQWNNGVGLEFESCSNVTVRNTLIRYNGERGMGTGMGENLHFENLTVYENNWRTNADKIISHDAAGIKLFGGNKNVMLDNIIAFNNKSHAIWFDWDNENYTIRNSTLSDNQEAGIMLEGSRKPALIQSCTLQNNGIGIKGYGHANVTIERSLIYGNHHQLSLGQDGRRVKQDSQWEINSKDWKIFHNQIIATESDQSLFTFFEYHNPDKPSTWASIDFFQTVRADYNTYFHPSNGKQFPDGKHLEGGQLTFENWKKLTGQDVHSEWESLNFRIILNN
ncbi:MAG: right-handed parallel beta-helix repeat-containing protein, partial [Cyclobacteriaceae bacterium]